MLHYRFLVRMGHIDRGRCFNGECKALCEYYNLTSCLCDQGMYMSVSPV